jgi:DNA-binding transcriptional MerR regulator
MSPETELLTAGDIARERGVSPDTVRGWERSGKLATAARTPGGVRLFNREAVQQFFDQRAQSQTHTKK